MSETIEKPWGPENPHPLSRMKTELVWEGKYDEYGNRRTVSLSDFPLVMQRIETIDEPRDAAKANALRQGDLFDQEAFTQSSHRDDFRNRLIWGDNKLALGALLQEFRGQVKLIYIDPPFDVGADFRMSVSIGSDARLEKEQSVLEAVAYRDTWGKSTSSYLHMLHERLTLMRELLSPDGTIFVHCDWRVQALIKGVLSELFTDGFLNQIVWHYRRWPVTSPMFQRSHDYIFWYRKGSAHTWNQPYQELSAATLKRFGGKRVKGETTKEVLDVDSLGAPMRDVWEIPHVLGANPERLDYPTQKPEALLSRIIEAASNNNDLIMDAFCGSGTALATAETLDRRWIGVDLGRYAIHTTRKRLIAVQRKLHAEGLPYRSFDIFNLGRYERQWWQQERLKGADEGHREAVLKFFKAQPLENAPNPLLHATRGGAYIHVDQIDSILTLEELKEVAKATHSAGGRKLVCLAWEFEMDLRLRARSLESELGLDIQLKYIPREIMEPNRNEIQFFDAAAIEAEAFKRDDGSYDVRLKTFLPSLTEVPEKELEALRERAIDSPSDFIDFWAVDFEHSDDKPFEHHWQDFRTRKDRSLKSESDAKWKFESKGTKQICIKVIDVFGIDTTTVVEVEA